MHTFDLTEKDVEVREPDIDSSGNVEFYVEMWFDVDKYFGIKTQDDDGCFVNFYVRYIASKDLLKAVYTLNGSSVTPTSRYACNDGDEFPWELSNGEQSMFRKVIERYIKNYEGYDSIQEFAEAYT